MEKERKEDVLTSGSLIPPIDPAAESKSKDIEREVSLKRTQVPDQSLDNFLQILSHESRSPITVILSACDIVLENEELPREKILSFIEAIQRAGKRLHTITEKTLLAVRLEGKPNLFPVKLSTQKLVSASMMKCLTLAHENNTSIEHNIEDSYVNVEESLIQPAIRYIIENAIQHSPKRGVVAIRGFISESNFFVTVSDRGKGMSEEFLKKVQNNNLWQENQHVGKGLGISIAIAKKAFELHGGSLKLDTYQGIGTKVTMSLPVKQASNS